MADESSDDLGVAPTLPGDVDQRRARARVAAELFGETASPVKISRFEILERLGAGGMGVVYAAHDPELARKVAIKLLRSDGVATADRVLEEARALARVSHPNVVPVYEAGTVSGEVFLVMELVRGRTLRVWLREARAHHEVLAAFIEAARGLAATHAAGLVHGDFKPDNVIVGDDGRVRVVDFGLARLRSVPDASTDTTLEVGATAPVRGTPAYMAPELFAGSPADPRSDQYAFCIALQEALWRDGDEAKAVVWLRHVRRAVMRGLSPTPEHRFESMDALIEVLQPRRRRWALLAGLAITTGVGGSAATLLLSGAAPCTDPAAALQGAWDDDARARVQAAFERSSLPYARAAEQSVQASFDEYAHQWQTQYVDACAATRVRGDQSEHVLDLRMLCLADRRAELAAVVQRLANADDALVKRAVRAASGLRSLHPCAEVDALIAIVPPPADPRAAAEVAALRARLASARALGLTGAYEDALAETATVADAAAALGYRPLIAEALHGIGDVQSASRRPEEAERTLLDAVWNAEAARDTRRAAEIWATLAEVRGHGLGRPAEAHAAAQRATAALEALGGDDLVAAHLAYAESLTYFEEEKLEPAEEQARRAVDLARVHATRNAPARPTTIEHLAVVLDHRGRDDEAEAMYREALELRRSMFGDAHPDVGTSRLNYGGYLYERERYEEALVSFEAAASIWTAALGPEHPVMGEALGMIGATLMWLGRLDEAEAKVRASLTIREAAHPDGHPTVDLGHNRLSEILLAQGRFEEAREIAQASIDAMSRRPNVGPTSLAGMLRIHGYTLLELERVDDALASFRRCNEILGEAHGPDATGRVPCLAGVGTALLDRGEAQPALEPLEHAVAICDRDAAVRSLPRAQALFALARALWASGGDRARARTLAQRAADALRTGGPWIASRRDPIESWLAAHPSSDSPPAR